MMLCSDEIFWGKIVSGNLPPWLLTTTVHPNRLIFVALRTSFHESSMLPARVLAVCSAARSPLLQSQQLRFPSG